MTQTMTQGLTVLPGLRVKVPGWKVQSLEAVSEDRVRISYEPIQPRPSQVVSEADDKAILQVLKTPQIAWGDTVDALATRYAMPSTDLPDKALDEFAELLKPGLWPIKQLAAFVVKYGPLWKPDPNMGDKLLPLTREVLYSRDELIRELTTMWELLEVFAEHKKPPEQSELDDALEVGESLPLRHDAVKMFAAMLSGRLRGKSHIEVWPEDDKLVPVLYCDDVLTGLYAILYTRLVADEPLSLCANDNCRRPFKVTKHGKRFCSLQCQQATLARRRRAVRNQQPTQA